MRLSQPYSAKVNVVEVFDDRCVYLNFMDYRNCFEVSEAEYEDLTFLLKLLSGNHPIEHESCCRYSGFLEYNFEGTQFRSCAWLIKNISTHPQKTEKNDCIKSDALEFESKLITILDRFIENSGYYRIRFDIPTLIRDNVSMSSKYGNSKNYCTGCIPSNFHLQSQDDVLKHQQNP